MRGYASGVQDASSSTLFDDPICPVDLRRRLGEAVGGMSVTPTRMATSLTALKLICGSLVQRSNAASRL